jgi:hypothetical protein
MAKAILVSGEPTVANLITPVDCEPGDVVLVNTLPMIAVVGGVDGDLVSFAVGGGVYRLDSQPENAPPQGERAWIHPETGIGGTGQVHFGICLTAGDDSCLVYHSPLGLED